MKTTNEKTQATFGKAPGLTVSRLVSPEHRPTTVFYS